MAIHVNRTDRPPSIICQMGEDVMMCKDRGRTFAFCGRRDPLRAKKMQFSLLVWFPQLSHLKDSEVINGMKIYPDKGGKLNSYLFK